MADQNFRVKHGLEVGVGGTVITATSSGLVGINSTQPTVELDVGGNGKFTGVVTATTFNGQVNAGVGTITTLNSTDSTLDNINSSGIATLGIVASNQLYVSGVSTFVGVGTFSGDLYVGGDLYVTDDIVFDELSARNINITGIGTIETRTNAPTR